jgi:DNA polymerase-3 subunit alpha
MNFASYFLINWDIVRYAQSKDYYYVGRGSGANSMVAYLLRITDVDPIDLDLYFERFINPYRSNPPDFDIDFSWTDRDDMTRYIFDRFGTQRTALLGAYNTFQHDAVIRELGKVFGLPPGEIDKLQMASKYPDIDDLGKMVLRYSDLIKGFPSHLSVHSSGIIISEEPITTYTATIMPPKGYPTTQFSMLEAEDIGLYKFDILSQRGLAKIKDALTLVKENKNVDLDVHNMQEYKDDERIKELLREGKAIGCFYVESPAMRMLLTKLKADDYLRLVAASSIIRPGVARSGMMREYIVRHRDPNKRKDINPLLLALMPDTYGVMVYQEDVIKVAHYFAGLSLAEADVLRRGDGTL